MATVKGLAWPLGKKAVGVSTLAALAMNIPCSTTAVCPVLDARKGEVYAALYDTSTGSPRAVLEDAAMPAEALCDEILKRGLGPSVVFLGTGLDVYSGLIRQRLPGARLAPGLSVVRAGAVGTIAFGKAAEAVDPARIAPVYLRKSEAEIKFG